MRIHIGCALGVLAIGLAGCPQVGLQCAATDVVCEQTCANINADPLHCGACGNQCPTGFACNAGVCGCPFGLTQCGQLCVSLQDSSANCGACGAACLGTSLCQQGSCVTSCTPGLTQCGQSCVDALTDNSVCGCGIDGGAGVVCSQGTLCKAGACTSDLLAACFSSGEIVSIDAEDETLSASTQTNPPLNPAAMALTGTGYLEVADTQVDQLEGFGLGSKVPMLVGQGPIGVGASSVTVSGNLAFVINSSDATLDVLDLTNPAAPVRVCSTGGGSAAGLPDGGCMASAAFTPGSFPEVAAVATDAVYVSIQGNVLLLDGGNEVARVDRTTFAVSYTAITGDLQASGTQARPFGVAIANNQLYVSLQNLAGYTASGPGLVDVFQLTAQPDGGTALGAQQIVSLGPGCLNAGDMLQVGTTLFVACGPQYGMDSSGNYIPVVPGALAGIDLTQNRAAFEPQSLGCLTSGGSCVSGGPTQIAYAGGKLFLGDSLQPRLFTADPATGVILRGPNNALSLATLCGGSTAGAGDFVSSVVGIP